jgi:hypothetical protein
MDSSQRTGLCQFFSVQRVTIISEELCGSILQKRIKTSKTSRSTRAALPVREQRNAFFRQDAGGACPLPA